MARGEAKKVIADSPVQSSDRLDIVEPTEPLVPEEQHRLEVLQRLQSNQDRVVYGVEQERAATEHGVALVVGRSSWSKAASGRSLAVNLW